MKKYSFLLSAFAHAQNKYASWTYPTDAQIEASLGKSLFFTSPHFDLSGLKPVPCNWDPS